MKIIVGGVRGLGRFVSNIESGRWQEIAESSGCAQFGKAGGQWGGHRATPAMLLRFTSLLEMTIGP